MEDAEPEPTARDERMHLHLASQGSRFAVAPSRILWAVVSASCRGLGPSSEPPRRVASLAVPLGQGHGLGRRVECAVRVVREQARLGQPGEQQRPPADDPDRRRLVEPLLQEREPPGRVAGQREGVSERSGEPGGPRGVVIASAEIERPLGTS